MALPIIPLSRYTTTLPISREQVQYRAFTVKEEKILLLAKETKSPTEMMQSLCQIVDNCTYGKIDINALNVADLEYLFLQIRIKSVSDVVELNYICKNKVDGEDCNSPILVELDLTKIKPEEYDLNSRRIKLTDTIGVQFRLPTVDDSINIIMKLGKSETKGKISDTNFLYSILDFVWDGDEVTSKQDTSEEEFTNFIESLGNSNFKKIEDFVNGLPSLHISVDTKCPKCGKESKIEFESLEDFFQ